MWDAVVSKLELDAPDEKGVSKRQHLVKVFEQSGKAPPELEAEVQPDFWDEPLFNTFFEIFQRDKEFFQTIYYYQQVMGFEFDGEDLNILNVLWTKASKYLIDKDKKKSAKKNKQSTPKGKSMVHRR